MAAGGTRKPARGSGDDADGTPAAPRSWKDAWPFLVALGVIVIAVVGLGLSYLLRPAEERVTDSTRVQYAINDHYTARNASDYTAYREHTCAADLASPSFITEQVFKVNGLGQLLILAINANDIPMVMTLTFIFAILIVTFTLIADLLYGVLDPRIRYD